ncbi:hypothetical protein A6P54_12890 [Bacillus sp. MKU004]|nr:hypothetical protein A6P54_12890 [Bacillus sp. MKU004]
MKKTTTILLLILSLIVIGITAVLSNQDEKTDLQQEYTIKFSKWDAVVDISSEPVLNLIFIGQFQGNSSSLKNEIIGIYFNQEDENIISSYDINKGDQVKDQNLYNLVINFNKENINPDDTLTSITMNFNNGESKTFQIGEITFLEGDGSAANIQPVGGYNVIYPRFEYKIELENTSNDPLTVKDLVFNNSNLAVNNISINENELKGADEVQPGEKFSITAEVSEQKKKEFDFYQVTPQLMTNKGQFTLPTHFYELNTITEAKTNNILNRK